MAFLIEPALAGSTKKPNFRGLDLSSNVPNISYLVVFNPSSFIVLVEFKEISGFDGILELGFKPLFIVDDKF